MENMDINLLLGQRIQELRKSKKMTQEYLAEKIGIEPASLSNIERGKYYPTADNITKIIEILDIEPLELFNFKHLAPHEKLLEEMNNTLIKDDKLTRLVYKFYMLVR